MRDEEWFQFEVLGLRRALMHHLPRGTDPFWTFPQLLARERQEQIQSTFYVIPSHGHRSDGNDPADYLRRRPALLRLLRQYDCEVGMHGNERDPRDLEGPLADRAALAELAGRPITGIRFHYLRCLYHETLPLLERAGLLYDSSLAFAEREGFRCGCSFPFRPYSVAQERPLDLVELPLAVMDSSLQERHYRGLPADEALPAALAVLERLRTSGGAAAVLWHQNRFDEFLGRGYGEVYWRMAAWVAERGGATGTAEDLVRRWVAQTEAP